jgi:hypothetical protein
LRAADGQHGASKDINNKLASNNMQMTNPDLLKCILQVLGIVYTGLADFLCLLQQAGICSSQKFAQKGVCHAAGDLLIIRRG